MAAVALSVVVLSGYAQWGGGFCLGIRYLVPVTFSRPSASVALKSVLSRWLFAVAVAFSVAQLFVLTASWPHIPWNVVWPAANLAGGRSSATGRPNRDSLGLPSVWSLVPA
jgi:hypothetical protein